MTANVVSAAFSIREGAGWTGIGQVIPANEARDPAKIAERMGATFQVLKRACFFQAKDGSYHPVEGREVLVRSDTGQMLEVVSDSRYHVANRQPIDLLEAFRDDLVANNLEISHAAVLSGGTQIAVCALLPPEFNITVGASDVVKSYITLTTGYDKKNGTRRGKSGVRAVCENTLAYAMMDAKSKGVLQTVRASTRLNEFTLKDMLANLTHDIQTEQATYNELANTEMSADSVSRYFADVLEINIENLGRFKADGSKLISTKSENMLRELSHAYASAPGAALANGTAWGALNAVTYYATHVKTCRDTSGSGAQASRVASNMNGDAARLKMRALELAASKLVKVAA